MIAKIDTLNKKFGKRFRLFVILILAVFMVYWLLFVRNTHHDEYHVHAGFKVFLDDKPVDFSASKYMYFQPCGLPSSQQKALKDKVHLHDRIGDVVHVHAEGVKWDDLFTSLKYEIPKNKNLSFYVDGIKTGDLLNTIIKDNQSVIIVIDGKKEDKEYLKDKVSSEKIEKVAKTKENCGE